MQKAVEQLKEHDRACTGPLIGKDGKPLWAASLGKSSSPELRRVVTASVVAAHACFIGNLIGFLEGTQFAIKYSCKKIATALSPDKPSEEIEPPFAFECLGVKLL